MASVRNILFIMCDQLRRDYLGCYGNPALRTPTIDDHLGRLMAERDALGRREDTLIVFTSDHGDLLGDHWLGEKEMFQEPSAGVPLIIVDPQAARPATVDDAPVQAIDLLPTILDVLGHPTRAQWLEGHSLLPAMRSEVSLPAGSAVSELDYAFYDARGALKVDVNRANAVMNCAHRWKLIRYVGFAN